MTPLEGARLDGDRIFVARAAHGVLAALLVVVAIMSLAVGATGISLFEVMGKLISGEELSLSERIVLFEIRLPRTIVGILVGAGLAVSGVILQGLFRNPLADPGIIGVSAGASLGAITAIVLGPLLLVIVTPLLPALVQPFIAPFLVPISAFFGAALSVLLLYSVATRGGRTSVATLLLAGIALAALVGAVSGVLVYMADDQQLRDLTFWGLGSLSGSSWIKIVTAGPIILLSVIGACFLGHGLNGFAMGEATAMHMGVPVQFVKFCSVLAVAGATGAAVAISGGIGFIGIVVPHLLRLATGPDHGPLLINSALLGASLLLGADVIARVIIAPSELPIGIVTALIGAPVFMWILLRRRGMVDL